MKKYVFRSLLPILGALLLYSNSFGQVGIVCPSVTPSGIPAVAGSGGVTLSCDTPCAKLWASMNTTLNATTSYTVASVPYSAFSYTAGTTPVYGTGTLLTSIDDWYSNVIPLPFSFCYFGATYNSVVIGVNGNISFNTSVANTYDPWSISGPLPGAATAAATQNAILSPWQDLLPTVGGTIKYASYGTAPCRQFVVSWGNMGLFGSAPAADSSTYQIVLYESSNIIDINIQKRVAFTSWNSGRAITGIVNNTAAATTFYTPPGENGTTFNALNESWRFTPNGTVSAWNYTWTGPSGVVGTGDTINVCPSVNTVYTVTASATACAAVSATTTIPVVVNPLTAISGTLAVCQGFTSTLTDLSPGGTWSSANPAVATIGSTSGVVTAISGGTSSITYTALSGCHGIAVFTVNPTPAISGTTTLCAGGNATLTASVPGGTWSVVNTGVATIGSTSGSLTGVATGATTASYTTPAGCVNGVVVNVVPLPPITGPAAVCMGSSISLANTIAGGTWASSNTAVATIDPASGVLTGVSGGTTTVTYTSASNCYVIATITVNPVVPITGTPEMCQYFTTTLATTIPGGTWTSSNAAVATVNAANGVVTGVTGGTATIGYLSPAGCIMTKIVTVHPKPSAPTQLPPTSYCQFTIPVPVSATGSSLTWYGPGVTAGYTVSPTPGTATPGLTAYYVTQTSTFGCVSDSGTVVITIIEKPAPPTVSDTMYCQDFGGAAPLSANGTNIHWYNESGTPIAGVPTPSTAMVGTTTYYADQTVAGCASDKVPLVVTVIFKPDFNISYSNNKVCQFDTLRFAYDGPVMIGPGYHWDIPYGATIVSGSIYDTAITVRFDSAGTPIIHLTASDLNGMCATLKALNIKVIAQPGAHGAISPDICLGDTVLLALSNRSDDASTFAWTVDGQPLTSTSLVNIVTASSSTGGPFLVTFNTSGRHIVVVQGSAEGMCASKPMADSFYVHGLPDATFKVKNIQSKFCIEDSVEFVANTTGLNYQYAWAPSHSFSDVNKPDVWGRAEQERSIISLTVTDPFGCKSTASLELDPETCCQVVMPSGFTPNGDSKNDTYKPIFNGFHRFHMFRITNRWGQTVFETTNSDPHWDGTYNGVPQDMGVYFFYIKFDCGGKTIEQKGDVTLVR